MKKEFIHLSHSNYSPSDGSELDEAILQTRKRTRLSADQADSIKQEDLESELRQKLQRLKQYMGALGETGRSSIGFEQLEHLEGNVDVYLRVKSEQVVQEAERRIEKMIKTGRLKRNWSVCDLKILVWLICKYCERQSIAVADIHNHQESWEFIASLIPGATAESCLFKWLSLKRYKITLHCWSREEEKILMALEHKYTQSRNKWKYISQELYTLNTEPEKIYRHPKQCREHYSSFLDPQIKKGAWTRSEDLALLANIVENEGEKKWCRLVKVLEGRTENAIKNRFQLLSSKLRGKKMAKDQSQLSLITSYLQKMKGDLAIGSQNGGQQNPPEQIGESKSVELSIRQQVQAQVQQVEPQSVFPIIPIATFNSCRSMTSIPSLSFVSYFFDPINIHLSGEAFPRLSRSTANLQVFPSKKEE